MNKISTRKSQQLTHNQRRNEGARRQQFLGRRIMREALNYCKERRRVATMSHPTSIFFNAVRLLPKKLRFQHGGTKLASCPERHLTSLRHCPQRIYY